MLRSFRAAARLRLPLQGPLRHAWRRHGARAWLPASLLPLRTNGRSCSLGRGQPTRRQREAAVTAVWPRLPVPRLARQRCSRNRLHSGLQHSAPIARSPVQWRRAHRLSVRVVRRRHTRARSSCRPAERRQRRPSLRTPLPLPSVLSAPAAPCSIQRRAMACIPATGLVLRRIGMRLPWNPFGRHSTRAGEISIAVQKVLWVVRTRL